MDEFVWEEEEVSEGEEPLGLLEQIMEEEEDRQNLKPRKRNNVKKIRDDEHIARVSRLRIASTTTSGVACPGCGAVDSLLDDVHTGTTVCRGCGAVRGDIAPDDVPLVPVPAHGGTDARINYFRERMRQWQCGEPPIPQAGNAALIRAYDDLRHMDGPLRVSDLLAKPEIRAICIHARLPPKNVVEKWLTVRAMLLRHAGLPNEYECPSTDLVEFMVDKFIQFVHAWDRHPELRRGRTSLVNYNYQNENYLLMYGVEAYVKHSVWFPQVTAAKREKLVPIWTDFCVVLDWPMYTAEFRPDGTCVRVLQRTATSKRSALVRRRPEEPQRRSLRQGTLDRWTAPRPETEQPVPDNPENSTSE